MRNRDDCRARRSWTAASRSAWAASIALATAALLGSIRTTAAAETSAAPAEALEAVPTASQILRSMKNAVEPAHASLRRVDITLSTGDGARHWTALEARAPRADGTSRLAMVLTAPAELKGTAIMIDEQKTGPSRKWMWLPTVGRVREIVPATGFESFLGTDFTYADLGFVPIGGRRLGPVTRVKSHGEDAYLLREDVEDNPWFYSRIDTTVASDSMLPLERTFYGAGGEPWKKEVFEKVETIEGVPTPLVVRMQELPDGSWTQMAFDHVDYVDELPGDLFDPTRLPRLLDQPVWKKLDLD